VVLNSHNLMAMTRMGRSSSCTLVHVVDIDLQLVNSHITRHNCAKKELFQNIAAPFCSLTVDQWTL
jgi:hypothetical protein